MVRSLTITIALTICQLHWTSLSHALPVQQGSRTSLSGKMTSACTAPGIAVYNVTMETFWGAAAFPKQYPTFRPHAQWSRLIGRTHSDAYRLWSEGHLASAAVKHFTTTKDAGEFDLESQGHRGIFDAFGAPRITDGVGMTSTDMYADATHSLVSLIVHMIPSPDWFVGLDHVSLCSGSDWVDQVVQDLRIWDAGVDKGFTYTAPNWPEEPQLPITEITSQLPNHVASSLFYEHLEYLPKIARVTISRESQGKTPHAKLAENPPLRDWGGPMGEHSSNSDYKQHLQADTRDKKNELISKGNPALKSVPNDAASVPLGENTSGSGSTVPRKHNTLSTAVGKKETQLPVGVPPKQEVSSGSSGEKQEVMTKEEKRRKRRKKKKVPTATLR